MNAADVVRTYWEAAEARDWDRFAATLAPDVVYEMRQTRERVRGRDAYVRFNQEYPGDWHLSIERIVGDEEAVATWVDFRVDDEAMAGITFFTVMGGLITTVQDVWPEPYEPPEGRAHLVERL